MGDQQNASSSPSPSEAAATTKRATLLPFYVTEQFEMSAMFTYWLPWDAPALMGMSGTSANQPDTLTSVVGFEWPIQHLTPTARIDQRELERIHLDRYFTDYLLATGTPPFFNIIQTSQVPTRPTLRYLPRMAQKASTAFS